MAPQSSDLRPRLVEMKREATAVAVLFIWSLLGCATRPPELYFANGPGPHGWVAHTVRANGVCSGSGVARGSVQALGSTFEAAIPLDI